MQCEKYDDKAVSNEPPQAAKQRCCNFSIALGARIRIHSEKKTRLTTANANQRLIPKKHLLHSK